MVTTGEFDARSRRRRKNEAVLATVAPWFAAIVRKWLERCEEAGILGVCLEEGYRSPTRQAELYGLGRTASEVELAGLCTDVAVPGVPKVTNAGPMESAHNVLKAVDWNAQSFPLRERLQAANLAKEVGLESGHFYSFRDSRHLQVKGWHPRRR